MTNKVIAAIVHAIGLYTQDDVDHLKVLSGTDELTGLLNRRGEKEKAADAINIMRRTGSICDNMCILAIDLDNFKQVNDSYGHETGDHVLKNCARLLRSVFHRQTDRICRKGGDEFVVVLMGTTTNQAQTLAKKLLDLINSDHHLQFDRVGQVTASIGIAPLDTKMDNINEAYEQAMAMADAAMYEAKANGRNRFVTKTA